MVDNWSGASMLPSLYEAVKGQPRQHTYIFIGFTDEEQGLVGSRSYVRQMTKQQVAVTDAMVNMDTLGLAPSEVWASHSDKRLTSALVNIARRLNFPITGVNVEQIGSSDGEVFAERKIPRITVHSLTQASWSAGVLHSSHCQSGRSSPQEPRCREVRGNFKKGAGPWAGSSRPHNPKGFAAMPLECDDRIVRLLRYYDSTSTSGVLSSRLSASTRPAVARNWLV